ncbi:hypothetical protein ACPCK9_10515 [Streptomyces koyangensis]|uniref:hypothetical protein n=1 Tax=Streptomyces koyangensis TaxID=188770 RepID=UPI003C2D2EA3
MTGTHDLTALVTSAWEAVDDPTTARGDLSLDAIGDVLETGRLPRDEAERAAERLVALALSAKDDPVRESALHALCLSTGQYRLPYRTLAPLAEHGDAFAPVLLPTSSPPSVRRTTGKPCRWFSGTSATLVPRYAQRPPRPFTNCVWEQRVLS